MAYFLIILGAIFRLLPHLPNATPTAAIALFGGANLDRRTALIVPLMIMIISDIIIGLHPLVLFVWGSFLLTGMIGLWIRDHRTVANIIGASLLSSFSFFIITNFGVWASPGSWYPHTWQGLLNCYLMAVPFFRNTLAGDLCFVGIMFGLYELAKASIMKRSSAKNLI